MDNYYCKVLYIVLLHLVKCRAPSAHCKTGKFCRDCACGQNRPALGGGHTPKKYVHLSLIIQFFFILFYFSGLCTTISHPAIFSWSCCTTISHPAILFFSYHYICCFVSFSSWTEGR